MAVTGLPCLPHEALMPLSLNEDAAPSPFREIPEASELRRATSTPTVGSFGGRGKKRVQVAAGAEEDEDGPAAQSAIRSVETAPQKRSKANAPATAEKAAAEQALRYQGSLARSLSKAAQAERREVRERLRRDSRRLGTFRRGLYGGGVDRDAAVQWDGGTDNEELDLLRKRILEQKQQIEKLQQTVKTRQKSKRGGEQNQTAEELEEDLWEMRELCVAKSEALKRCETDLRDKEIKLNIERAEHLRQFRATEAEDQMNFGGFQPVNLRYQLLRLLSRTGSTEVFEAYDVTMLLPCLVKIHHLNLDQETKGPRLEALGRECEAVKSLRQGSAFAALLENFELEGGSKYVTVWEYFEGESFATFSLRLRNAPLTEKEARGMLLQLIGALKVAQKAGLSLSTLELKPSRLAFRGGELKINSVGLPTLRSSTPASLHRARSNLEVPGDSPGPEMGDDDLSDGMSQAVGLAGAILYELLFGKPPAPQSGGAAPVAIDLPDNPRISQECRDCLCRMIDRESRTTVQDISADPFFAPAKRR